MKKPTRVNHPPRVELAPDNHPVVAPIYQTVKFEFDSLDETMKRLRGERPGFFYTRASNPTTRQLELTLAELQGRDDCLVTASGVGAIAQTLLALTKAGDHILCFVETYNPSRYLIRRLLGRFGVTNTMLSIEDLDGIERDARGAADEARVLREPHESGDQDRGHRGDHAARAREGRAHGDGQHVRRLPSARRVRRRRVRAQPHEVRLRRRRRDGRRGDRAAATSFASMRTDFGAMGGSLDPHAAFLIQRGLKTYFVRYQRAVRERDAHRGAARGAARGGARALSRAFPPIRSIALANAQMKEFGTIVTCDFKGGLAAGDKFAEALKLFALTASLGSTESLVVAPQMMRGRDLTPEQLRMSP